MSNLLGFVPLFIAFFAAAPAIMWWPEVFTSKNSLSERYTALMMACLDIKSVSRAVIN